jgi:hypothetical protein
MVTVSRNTSVLAKCRHPNTTFAFTPCALASPTRLRSLTRGVGEPVPPLRGSVQAALCRRKYFTRACSGSENRHPLSFEADSLRNERQYGRNK